MITRQSATALLAAALLLSCNASRSGNLEPSDAERDGSELDSEGGDAAGDATSDAVGDTAPDAIVVGPNEPWPEGEIELGVIFPAEIEPLDDVGQALDMGWRADGTRVIVVGDDSNDPGGEFNFVGRVTVFTQAPGAREWVEEASLRPSDPSQQLRFGVSVAYESDVIVTGAIDFPADPGRLYVFERLNNEWVETAQIASPMGSEDSMDNFGSAVDLSNGRLAVSAAGPGSESGDDLVWIFERPTGVWEPTAVIRSPDSMGDTFGRSISLDGDRIAVGDSTATSTIDGDIVVAHGAAYVFDRLDNGAWVLAAQLTPSNAQDYDAMGRSISLRGDMLAVGAPGIWGINLTGTVRIFERVGEQWLETAAFTGSATDLHQEFGASVALDPPNLLVGALLEANGARDTGGAYLFSFEDDAWSERVHWEPPTDETQQQFGFQVALLGDTAAIASRRDDSGANSGGAVFVATRP